MQIEIDFDVFKALTALRESESDSYNAVLRRLLELPTASQSQLPLEHNGSDLPNLKRAVDNGIGPNLPNIQRALGKGDGSDLHNVQRAVDRATKIIEEMTANCSPKSAIDISLIYSNGAWFDNIYFPNGTQFRAYYKGQLFLAEIRDDRWIGQDGVVRTSPSAAASAISNTNVNGWRFWHALLPGETEWKRLDAFKS